MLSSPSSVVNFLTPPAGFTTICFAGKRSRSKAWSAWPVRAVDVSTDGGATWEPARVAPRGGDHQWQAFSYAWDAAAPGRYAVHARATDEHGRRQPPTGRNRVHTIDVTVE